jgi:hypothetical protein
LDKYFKVVRHLEIAERIIYKGSLSKARASQMFDVLNKITLDAIISPKSEGERKLAALHFLKLQPEDLILMDRGYPAHWLFKLVLAMNSQFCARISYEKWKVEEDYKTLKYRLQVENFSGKTVHWVYQDFHAKLLSKNIAAIIAATMKSKIIEKSLNLEYLHQINFARAL